MNASNRTWTIFLDILVSYVSGQGLRSREHGWKTKVGAVLFRTGLVGPGQRVERNLAASEGLEMTWRTMDSLRLRADLRAEQMHRNGEEGHGTVGSRGEPAYFLLR
jgi:hypothetical protein